MITGKRTKIPYRPRFDFVTDTAYAMLIEMGYDRFPISPFKVLEDMSDYITVLTWSKAREFFKVPDPLHLKGTKSEARTIRDAKEGIYYIVYDDDSNYSSARISWTLMHEIGHVVLGHLTDFEETSLSRGGLNKKKYNVLEVEAHYFAAEFFMPTTLLKNFPNLTVDLIMLLFGVSEQAATKKYKKLSSGSYMPPTDYDYKLYRNFHEFLHNEVDKTIYNNIPRIMGLPCNSSHNSLFRKCLNCLTYISHQEAIFCSYCGEVVNKDIPHSNPLEYMNKLQAFVYGPGASHPQLPYVETEYEGQKILRTAFCVNCLNHDVNNGVYCKICGSPLFSVCKKCGRPLGMNDCFCPFCGGESTIHELYLSAEWRLNRIKNCSVPCQHSEDLLKYPYWDFVKAVLITSKDSANNDLKTSLFYSNAYIDDEDNLFICTDTQVASAIIYAQRNMV